MCQKRCATAASVHPVASVIQEVISGGCPNHSRVNFLRRCARCRRCKLALDLPAMARFALTNACFRPLLVAAALTPATYAAQAQDYRLTETTHACDDWRPVKSANSNQTTIRGNRNCGPAPEGRDVRLLRWSCVGGAGQVC